jgi:GxxExxY protein
MPHASNFDGITEFLELTEFMKGLPEDYSPHELMARKIIGLAMKVHRELGCGFVESIYRGALAIELREAQVEFEVHPVLPVFYKGEEVGVFQADIIIANHLIVELKAVEALTVPHSIQLINYLSAAQIDHGLLLNFGAKSLQFKTKHRTSSADDPPIGPINLHS